jgi:hypothetical protein
MEFKKRKNLRKKIEEKYIVEEEEVPSILTIQMKKRRAGILASSLSKVENTVKENSLGLLINFNTQEVVLPMASNSSGSVAQTVQELNKSVTAPNIYFPNQKKDLISAMSQKQIHHHRTIDYSRFYKRSFVINPFN